MESSPIDVVTLTARVEKLESANRRWKLVNAALLLSGVSILLMGAKPAVRVAAAKKADRVDPDVIHARSVEAQEFVLKDERGDVYARLSLNSETGKQPRGRNNLVPSPQVPGQASLQFYDEKGQLVWSAPAKPQFMPVK
jgi:hypothetical protein